MPTGYTYIIEEGNPTFREFVLKCARAMGACIMQRDDASDAPIDMNEKPSTFYADYLASAQATLAKLESMTLTEAETECDREFESRCKEREKQMAKDSEIAAKYRAMREQVETWEPPTTDHEGLKKFMLEQIDISTKGTGTYWRDMKITRASAADWLAVRIQDAKESIERYKQEHEKEVARVNARNEWKRQLVSALEAPVAAQ